MAFKVSTSNGIAPCYVNQSQVQQVEGACQPFQFWIGWPAPPSWSDWPSLHKVVSLNGFSTAIPSPGQGALKEGCCSRGHFCSYLAASAPAIASYRALQYCMDTEPCHEDACLTGLVDPADDTRSPGITTDFMCHCPADFKAARFNMLRPQCHKGHPSQAKSSEATQPICLCERCRGVKCSFPSTLQLHTTVRKGRTGNAGRQKLKGVGQEAHTDARLPLCNHARDILQD